MELKPEQIKAIQKNYQKLKSIRKTATLLNIKPNQIYKVIKLNPKTKLIELKETKIEPISLTNPKEQTNLKIQNLTDSLILKLLKELKLNYKDLKPREISQAVSALLSGKIKLEALKLEDNKANLIAEVYGNMENMLKLYNEIKDIPPDASIETKALETSTLESSKLEELSKIT